MPSEAYGETDPNAVFTVETAQLPGSEGLSVGQQVYLQNAYGQPVPVKVAAKDDKTVTFDANHEMAGKELNLRLNWWKYRKNNNSKEKSGKERRKMKILVLCGGSSPERNISIKCGSRVCRALRENGHNAVLLDVMSGVNPDIFERSAGEYDLEADVERFRAMNEDIFKGLQNDTITEFVGKGLLDAAKKADVVFPVTHGVNGEDGKLQALLELYGIKYTGAGILSSAISMNKTMSRLTVSSSGVPVADGITISREDYEADPSKYTLSELGLGGRVIVKPESGGSSIGTTDASNEEGFRISLKEAFTYDEYVVVERFIEGREFSVGVVGKKSYPVVEISVPAGEFYDYKNKYGNVAIETVPADIPEEKAIEIRALAELAAKALRIDSYCRIDFMMDNQGKVYFLEVNNLPGMTPTSLIGKSAAAVGLSFSELCETVIRLVPERR